MKGRKPKTAAQQIAEGDPAKRGVRKLRARQAAEPKATVGIPDCPGHLTGRAREAWNFWVPELRLMGIDKLPDAMMLEGACSGYSQAVQADLIIAEEGPVCEHFTVDINTHREVRKLKAHPAVAISRSAWSQVRSFCSEFGLSPVSRTRLTIEKNDDAAEDLLELLSKPRRERIITTVN